jgi:oligopeptide/dipeptide ABC transporter ATP-binding protein
MNAASTGPLLSIRGLKVAFDSPRGPVHAVDAVDVDVPAGKTVALVGESGCGKSVTAMSVLRLLPRPPARILAGEIHFRDPRGGESVDLLSISLAKLRAIRGHRIGFVFQEPMTAMNPVYSVGEQIVEAIRLHESVSKQAARWRTIQLLERVGITDAALRAGDPPHRFSGGMLQRAMIALALACRPALLIADEPTTALDASLQRNMLALLSDLQHEFGMSILLITHDLRLIEGFAVEVNVMYAGSIVERAATVDLIRRPLHPYSKALLECSPSVAWDRARPLPEIPGQVPAGGSFPSGCRFHPRCRWTAELAGAGAEASVAVPDSIAGRTLRSCAEIPVRLAGPCSDTAEGTDTSDRLVACDKLNLSLERFARC